MSNETQDKVLTPAVAAEKREAIAEAQKATAVEALIPAQANGTGPVPLVSDKEAINFRQNSLNFAVGFFQNATDEQKAELDVITVADRFYNFIIEGVTD